MIKKICIASNSPRRRELVKYLGLPFETASVDTDETNHPEDPEKAAVCIAERKALKCLADRGLADGEVIIGADTVVVLDGLILGKPRDREDAFATLKLLSGKSHFVYTGVTLVYRDAEGNERAVEFAEKTLVRFADISAAEINAYLDTGEYADKAGSYAIQGVFSRHIERIEGDYNNVVGFPVARIYAELAKM